MCPSVACGLVGCVCLERAIHQDRWSRCSPLLRCGRGQRHDQGADATVPVAGCWTRAFPRRWTSLRGEKVNHGYASRLLRLILVAPGVIEAILDGRQAEGRWLQDLLEGVPVKSKCQRVRIGMTHPLPRNVPRERLTTEFSIDPRPRHTSAPIRGYASPRNKGWDRRFRNARLRGRGSTRTRA